MGWYSRPLIALIILLSGLALVPQTTLLAGNVHWQRFARGYEDTVHVTVARYYDTVVEGGNLEVRATNAAGSNATLSVYRTTDNALIGTLTWTGTDHYGLFAQTTNPESITIRSTAGGETTIVVETVPSAVSLSTLDTSQSNPTTMVLVALGVLAGIAAIAVTVRRR